MRLEMMTKNLRDLRVFAAIVAKEVLRQSRSQRHAFVLALVGELGSGKTTFTKAFGRALGLRRSITSPTFLMLRAYPFSKGRKELVHIDCFRMQSSRELVALGIRDIVRDPRRIVVIEWAERARRVLPKGAVWIRFQFGERASWRYITADTRPF